jgi:hypothetical protein
VRGNAPEQFHNHEVNEETRSEKEWRFSLTRHLLPMKEIQGRAVLNVTKHIIKSKYILTLMNFSNTVNILQNGIENYRASTMVIGHRGLKKFAFNLCLLNVFSVV